MSNTLKKFIADESGATAIEYGLIAAVLSVGISAAISSLKTQVSTTFTSAATAMQSANQ